MIDPKVNAPCSRGFDCLAFPTSFGGACAATDCPELQRLFREAAAARSDRREALSFLDPDKLLQAAFDGNEGANSPDPAPRGLPLTTASVILSALRMQDPEAADQATNDQLLLGNCFLMIDADGKVQRIAPELVTIRRPPANEDEIFERRRRVIARGLLDALLRSLPLMLCTEGAEFAGRLDVNATRLRAVRAAFEAFAQHAPFQVSEGRFEADDLAWAAMVDALERAQASVPIGDGLLTAIEDALRLAGQARQPPPETR